MCFQVLGHLLFLRKFLATVVTLKLLDFIMFCEDVSLKTKLICENLSTRQIVIIPECAFEIKCFIYVDWIPQYLSYLVVHNIFRDIPIAERTFIAFICGLERRWHDLISFIQVLCKLRLEKHYVLVLSLIIIEFFHEVFGIINRIVVY